MNQLTIAIPAYNEENNIKVLLNSILKQKFSSLSLKEIVVLDDGSTDNTVNEARKIKNSLVKVLTSSRNQGKIAQVNKAFKYATSELLVILDADIKLKDIFTLQKLVEPALRDSKIQVVFGNQSALEPKTFIEKLAYFGFHVWEDVKKLLGEKANKYRVHGQIRVFRKAFYSGFSIPQDIMSEDSYCYFYTYINKIPVVFNSEAVAYFRLPTTLKDYIYQMNRYINGALYIKPHFDHDLIKVHNNIPKRTKLTALIHRFLHSSPTISVSYVFLQIITRVASLSYKKESKWKISPSTKILN